jgi:hypothetical protein
MSASPSSSHPRRSARFAGWLAGAAALAATALIAPEAAAADGETFSLMSTVFGPPNRQWTMAPPLHLQPEGARLVLYLPSEWMPPPDYGVLGVPFDPNKHWEFRRSSALTRATLGTSVHLHVNDPSHSIEFGLSLLPRAAIAVLHFDPAAWAR